MEVDEIINDIYYPLLWNYSRYLVLIGGAGSGKSVFAAQKVITRCLTEKHRFLIIRKVSDTLKDSVFKLITGKLGESGILPLCDVNKTEKTILFPNGSEIIMKGLDDPEKIKSIAGITGIWIEEATELQEGDFDQLDLRLRGETETYKQIIFTFNPIDERHWLKKRFFDVQQENCTTLHSTYEDNDFIDAEYKEILDQKSKVSPNFYRVYKLGQWGKPDVISPFMYNFEDRHVGETVIYSNIPLRFTLDFNFNPFVCLMFQLWKDKDGHHVHFHREHTLVNKGVKEMIELLRGTYTPAQLANALFTGDATQRKSSVEQTIRGNENIHAWKQIDEAFRLGKRLHTPRANPNVKGSRNFCNTILSLHPDVIFNESMKNTINEMRFTEADEEGNILKKDRNKLEQRADYLDAGRYGLHTWMPDFVENINFYCKK